MKWPMMIWNGSKAEAVELSAAALHNCECDQPSNRTCATHRDMKTDQKYLDDLVFYRRQRDKLNAEERLEARPNAQ